MDKDKHLTSVWMFISLAGDFANAEDIVRKKTYNLSSKAEQLIKQIQQTKLRF